MVGKHVIVYGEPGRFGGWPANKGYSLWINYVTNILCTEQIHLYAFLTMIQHIPEVSSLSEFR